MNFQNPLVEFVTNENVELLWEVVLENSDDVTNYGEFRKQFIESLKGFFQEEEKQTQTGKFDLVETNKKFILKFVSKNREAKKKQGEFVTAEDIQKNRMNEFEQEFFKKQNEFKQFMTHSVPETPQFGDKMDDEPIGENMEKLIALTLSQRNLDIEKLQPNVDKKEVEKWLKGENTSVKPILNNQTSNTTNGTKIKYIKIGDEINTNQSVIEIVEENKYREEMPKKVSWDDQMIENKQEMQNTLNIFSKLKQVSNEVSGQVHDEDNMRMIDKMELMMKKIDELNNKLNAFIEETKNQKSLA